MDGPDDLNDVRWAGTLSLTREATAKTHAAIERLVREGLTPSLIVTLHRNNATADKLPRMRDWFRYLDMLGITSARLHDLEIESPAVGAKYELTVDEQVAAFLDFAALESELRQLRFDVFSDIRKMLLGEDQSTTCVWNACDPYTTRAVQGVEGHGQRSNCGRTNKDGIDFVKADREGFERYLALYHAPQDAGGCHGCRFFVMCKGQCPGRRDRRRLAKPIEQVRIVDGPVRAIRGGDRRGRAGAHLAGPDRTPPRTVRAAGVGGGTERVPLSGGREVTPAEGGCVLTSGTPTRSPAAVEAFQRDSGAAELAPIAD